MRVRPALRDLVAALRRSQYHGKKRHALNMKGVGDACNKAFSVTAGLTQGVFNVVCLTLSRLAYAVCSLQRVWLRCSPSSLSGSRACPR